MEPPLNNFDALISTGGVGFRQKLSLFTDISGLSYVHLPTVVSRGLGDDSA